MVRELSLQVPVEPELPVIVWPLVVAGAPPGFSSGVIPTGTVSTTVMSWASLVPTDETVTVYLICWPADVSQPLPPTPSASFPPLELLPGVVSHVGSDRAAPDVVETSLSMLMAGSVTVNVSEAGPSVVDHEGELGSS